MSIPPIHPSPMIKNTKKSKNKKDYLDCLSPYDPPPHLLWLLPNILKRNNSHLRKKKTKSTRENKSESEKKKVQEIYPLPPDLFFQREKEKKRGNIET